MDIQPRARSASVGGNKQTANVLQERPLRDNWLNNQTKPSAVTAPKISRLQDQADEFTKKIEIEKRTILELEQQIAAVNQEVIEQRKKMGGVNAAKEANYLISKRMKILENRLDKVMIKYNEALTRNRELHDVIDNLRWERLITSQIQDALYKELQHKRRDISRIVEISNLAYASRDAAKNELAALKSQADKEKSIFESEWRYLGRLLDQDRQIRETVRTTQKLESEEAQRKALGLDEPGLLKRLRGLNLPRRWTEKLLQPANENEKQTLSYANIFARLRQEMGVEDVDALINMLITTEDQNFSLFNFMNMINQDIDKFEDQIEELNKQIQKLQGPTKESDELRKKTLKDLEDKLEHIEAKSKIFEDINDNATKALIGCMAEIMSVFRALGCRTDDPYGDVMEISERNAMQFLGFIEHRLNEILQMFVASLLNLDNPTGMELVMEAILGDGPQVASGSVMTGIVPPTSSDHQEEFLRQMAGDHVVINDDDSSHPFFGDELREVVRTCMEKRTTETKERGRKKATPTAVTATAPTVIISAAPVLKKIPTWQTHRLGDKKFYAKAEEGAEETA